MSDVRMNLMWPVELERRVREAAKAEGVSKAEIVRRALDWWFERADLSEKPISRKYFLELEERVRGIEDRMSDFESGRWA